MMSSSRLLFRRIRENTSYQYGILKTIFDWTVVVYLLIPSMVIGIFIYSSWWATPPGWITSIPFAALFIFFYFLLWGGQVHTYMREADRIFLRVNKPLMLGLKQKGL